MEWKMNIDQKPNQDQFIRAGNLETREDMIGVVWKDEGGALFVDDETGAQLYFDCWHELPSLPKRQPC